MLRFLFLITLLAALSGAQPAVASAQRDAFDAAESKDWNNAINYAKRDGDPVLLKLITWEYALDNDSGASFEEIARFINENPSWPEQKKLHLRAEMSLRTSDVPDSAIIAWFGDETPITGVGKIALAEALLRSKNAPSSRTNELIRDAWKNGDFDEAQEQKIYNSYGSLLRAEDHNARLSRLLWEERLSPAKRNLHYANAGNQLLFKARIALQENKHLAAAALARVPAGLKNDPGLIFDRMMFRSRHDDVSGVRDMLLTAPAHPPYPEKWWRFREYQVRKAIDERKYALAKTLLDGHGQLDGQGYADAVWLQGWLKTEFMNNPKGGLTDFSNMYAKVRYPVSKARAAFWAGRAAEKSGNIKSAQQWYETATAFPTTFYGQMGALKASATATLDIPDTPEISGDAKDSFAHSDLIKAIKLCIEMKELDFASHLISVTIESSDSPAEIAMLCELGHKADQPHLSVHAAKKALQQNVVLIDAGYPTPSTPSSKPIERALTLAITRQESEFDPAARSPSGAVGMMQLLPGTAKEVARKNDMPFSPAKLLQPDYNMNLGSLYLARLIGSYDGSYIMAIAAYNAGPGNVHNWVQTFGTPSNNIDNAINWIEKIPFKETRNYVQRVLENLQVFRHIESDDEHPRLRLDEDLIR